MDIFNGYARYYDAFYKDKDYQGEATYIVNLIKRYRPNAKSILDLGCGTGKHAELLAKEGFEVHGVDKSVAMLQEADKRLINGIKLSFSYGNIQELDLELKYDVVIAMFHVMSYQVTNLELQKAFASARKHLSAEGILIFDCWYGPAVLTDKPVVRVKRMVEEDVEAIRIAEPEMRVSENIVVVNYNIFVKDKKLCNYREFNEKHVMRYIFDTEVDMHFMSVGMKKISAFEFMSNRVPGYDTWNVCFVGEVLE